MCGIFLCFNINSYLIMSCLPQLELPMSRVRDVILASFATDKRQFAVEKWQFLQKVVNSCICCFQSVFLFLTKNRSRITESRINRMVRKETNSNPNNLSHNLVISLLETLM